MKKKVETLLHIKNVEFDILLISQLATFFSQNKNFSLFRKFFFRFVTCFFLFVTFFSIITLQPWTLIQAVFASP